MRRATTLAWLLVAALSACDGPVASTSRQKSQLSFDLDWSYRARGEETRWEISCRGDEWVHVKTHYHSAASGVMEGALSVTPAYLQAIRQEAGKQRFFELRGAFPPPESHDPLTMTLVELRLTIDGETLRMHLKDPKESMNADQYRRFLAVVDAIVGSLPAGPQLER